MSNKTILEDCTSGDLVYLYPDDKHLFLYMVTRCISEINYTSLIDLKTGYSVGAPNKTKIDTYVGRFNYLDSNQKALILSDGVG